MTWAGAPVQPVRSAESLAEVSALLWHSGRGNKKERKKSRWLKSENAIIIHNAVFQEGFISLGLGRAEICKATSSYFSILEDED